MATLGSRVSKNLKDAPGAESGSKSGRMTTVTDEHQDSENPVQAKKEILESITDLAAILESIAVNLKRQAAKLQQPKPCGLQEQPYHKMTWTDGRGKKGPYQMASRQNNCNSDLFNHLVAILKQNGGRLAAESWLYRYWLGRERDVIFRRLRKPSR